ncbi:hypothetical protein C7M84_019171 [Penaeus vannamei]|uniref:Uncharacterized protein n=1 Tax=Penaeus vannamei TaxID=6689 RepID=A0A423SFG6_PENVA|nr:hypothetical protein C7M84_019171 [Penaeus vannamei]
MRNACPRRPHTLHNWPASLVLLSRLEWQKWTHMLPLSGLREGEKNEVVQRDDYVKRLWDWGLGWGDSSVGLVGLMWIGEMGFAPLPFLLLHFLSFSSSYFPSPSLPTSTLAVVGTLRTEPVARREKPDGGWPFPRCEGRDHVAGLPSLFPSFPLPSSRPPPSLFLSYTSPSSPPSFSSSCLPPPLLCAFLFSLLSPFAIPPPLPYASFLPFFLIALPPSLLLSFYAFLFPSTLRLIAFSPSFPYFFFLFLSITSSFRHVYSFFISENQHNTMVEQTACSKNRGSVHLRIENRRILVLKDRCPSFAASFFLRVKCIRPRGEGKGGGGTRHRAKTPQLLAICFLAVAEEAAAQATGTAWVVFIGALVVSQPCDVIRALVNHRRELRGVLVRFLL